MGSDLSLAIFGVLLSAPFGHVGVARFELLPGHECELDVLGVPRQMPKCEVAREEPAAQGDCGDGTENRQYHASAQEPEQHNFNNENRGKGQCTAFSG